MRSAKHDSRRSITRRRKNRLYHWVDIDHVDHRDRAAELHALIFPTGLDFLNFKYNEQWAQSERRLKLIADDGLQPELADLCDVRIVTRLLEDHLAYGEVLGITKKKPRPRRC